MNPPTLRDYQERALVSCSEAYADGGRALLIVSPTGSGKTITMSELIRRSVSKGKRWAWYAHRRELLSQAAGALTALGLIVGHAGRNEGAPVQVVGAQTALARGEVIDCDGAAFDEAHHYAADEWGKLVVAHKSHGALIVGATATPARGDGKPLNHMFDRMIVVAQVPELIEAGHLVPCEWRGPRRVLGRGEIASLPVDAYIRFGEGRRNVVFAPNVPAAEVFAEQFRARGIGAVVVHGDMKTAARDEALAAFASGRVRVIVNCFVLTEGWDCPDCSVVTIARGVTSVSMFLQMVGRGLRPAPGKASALLLDLRGVCNVHGLPTDAREFSLDGEPIGRGSATGIGIRLCKICQTELSDGVTKCGTCGKEVPIEIPTATGDALEKWAGRRQEPTDKRVVSLARWLCETKKDGSRKDPMSAKLKYKAVYGHFPRNEVFNLAMQKTKST